MPDIHEHPLAQYTTAFNASREQLVAERDRQLRLGDNDGLTQMERGEARALAAALTSEIGHLDDANMAFLVKVFTGMIAPNEEVVAETVQMNAQLAAVVVDANRPAAMLRIITSFLDGAISVAKGQVAAAPS